VFRICERLGWTLAQWRLLSDDEQRDWLAREIYRETTLDALIDALQEQRSDKGTMVAWTPEVAAMLLSMKI